MQTISQTPPTPATAPAVAPAPVPGSITVIGSDGKRSTIILPGGGPVIAGTEGFSQLPPSKDDFAQGAAAGVFGGLFLLGLLAVYRRFKRRRSPAPVGQQISADSTERLERLERGMESIAIEIERISEGQRFVTKLLTETRAPALPVQKV